MLSRWLKQEPQLRTQLNSPDYGSRFRLRPPATALHGKYPLAEKQVFQWIQQQRFESFASVTYADIQEKMRDFTDQQCKASSRWLYNFLRRFQLTRRKVTTTHCISPHNNENIRAKIKAFGEFFKNHSCDSVWNMDQTPVWLNAQHYDYTIDNVGAKSVPVRTNPLNANPREKVTVILACSSTGQKLPPAIIVNSAAKKPRVRLLNDMLVFYQPGTSMANQDIMSKWIQVHFPDPMERTSANGTGKHLLIMDSFRAHLTEHVKQACSTKEITRAIIPGGLTSLLQPLDLTVNRSFKCKLKEFYHRNWHLYVTERGKFAYTNKFNLHLFTLACKHAWSAVTSETIRNGFLMMSRNTCQQQVDMT